MTVLRTLLLLLFCNMAFATEDSPETMLAFISRELVVSSNLRGDFSQRKYLSFVDKPFVSSGQFRLDRESGLFWHVIEPLESTMLVKEGRIFLDGKPVEDQGVGKLITIVMLGFMEGNLSGLTEVFSVSTEGVADGWSVSLTPRSSRLRAAIALIRIQGKHHLSSIEIVDAEQNRTLMQFSNVRSGSEEVVPRDKPQR
ncbi:MAG: outer membrane lipoprotein carrier protein LolA [Halioglobus sp.]|nr:outer membrane lipoprotein carrier protein LolA [Halioglobus sp.]